MAEDGRPLVAIDGDTTSRFAAIEAEIAEHIETSRRIGRRELPTMIAFVVAAFVLAVVVLHDWPPRVVQLPASSNVSAPG